MYVYKDINIIGMNQHIKCYCSSYLAIYYLGVNLSSIQVKVNLSQTVNFLEMSLNENSTQYLIKCFHLIYSCAKL